MLDTTEQVFDLAGNVIQEIDAKGEATLYSYDKLGRQYRTLDRLQHPTVRKFDRAGRLESVTDAQSKVTKYGYDSFGRLATTQYPDDGIVSIQHDDLGRMFVRTDQKGNTVTYVYDDGGRLLNRQYRTSNAGPVGTIADQDMFTYKDTGQIKTATSDRYSNTVTFEYDLAGRKTKETLSIGGQDFEVGTGYDELSRVDEITYPNGKKVDRKYNSRGLLNEVTYDDALIQERSYDDAWRLLRSGYRNGVVTLYNYFDDNRVRVILTANNGTQKVGTYVYGTDKNKNKTAETIFNGGVTRDYGWYAGANGYDAEDRLVAWNRTDGNRDDDWDLSPVGNWNRHDRRDSTGALSTTQYSHSDSHETVSVGNSVIAYDANGNRLTANDPADMYAWDFDNKLASVGDHFFEYDALGRRVAMSVGGETSVLVCNDQQLIAVYSLDGEEANLEQFFVYGNYIDEPLLMVAGSEKSYFSRNQQYSITALTNSAGSVVERYAYDAYGNTSTLSPTGTPRSVSAVGNPFTYTGRFNHASIGLMYFRARFYDSETGEFISRDPLEYVDGMSLYRGYFVPNGMDPFGLTDEYTRKEFAEFWKKTNPKAFDGMSEAEIKQFKKRLMETLDRGCIGMTCIRLGEYGNPDMSNCYKTKAQADAKKAEMKADKTCCKKKNLNGDESQPRVYSIHLRNDKGKDGRNPDLTFDPKTGAADLSNWDFDPRADIPHPDYPKGDWINFDYGYETSDGNMAHANHMHDPVLPTDTPKQAEKRLGLMKAYLSTLAEWKRSNRDFNEEVWCVSCEKDDIKP